MIDLPLAWLKSIHARAEAKEKQLKGKQWHLEGSNGLRHDDGFALGLVERHPR